MAMPVLTTFIPSVLHPAEIKGTSMYQSVWATILFYRKAFNLDVLVCYDEECLKTHGKI